MCARKRYTDNWRQINPHIIRSNKQYLEHPALAEYTAEIISLVIGSADPHNTPERHGTVVVIITGHMSSMYEQTKSVPHTDRYRYIGSTIAPKA